MSDQTEHSIDKVLSAEYFRRIGIEGVIHSLLPVIREMVISSRDQNESLKSELELERVKNAEQIKVIEAMVRGLKS